MAEKMGILGRKLGMTRIFAGDGAATAVTVIEAGPCPVTQIKTMEKDGFINKIGEENFCAHIDDALARANEIIEKSE